MPNNEVQKYTTTRQKIIAHRHSIIAIVILLIAIPVTLALALNRQTFLNFADGTSSLGSVEIHPGQIVVDKDVDSVSLSALIYDPLGDPVFNEEGLTRFEWSMSSENTVGTLSQADREISSFSPLSVGCTEIVVVAYFGEESTTGSIPVVVYDDGFVPLCGEGYANWPNSGMPISWVGEHAYVTADEFYLYANGRPFFANVTNVSVNTTTSPIINPNKAELEVGWTEDDIPMRIVFRFSKDENTWRVVDFKTRNGKLSNSSDWVQFDGFDGTTLGEELQLDEFKTDSRFDPYTKIFFKNLKIQPFLVETPDTGYYIYRNHSVLDLPSPGSRSGAYALLYKDGEFLVDQTNYEYIWSVDNPDISITTDSDHCDPLVFLVEFPVCPEHYVSATTEEYDVIGIIKLEIKDTTTGRIIAHTNYGVNQIPPDLDPILDPTVFKFDTVKLHGIGSGGDNTNPDLPGNQNPLRTTRDLMVDLEASDGSILSTVGQISYSSSSGYFSGDISFYDYIEAGDYLVKVKSPQFLRAQLDGIISIEPEAEVNMPAVSLVAGDVDDNNAVDIDDYQEIIDCYSDLLPPENCDADGKKERADVTDDGNVNANDYNLFLREISVAKGD